jgi:tRNA nucleotidyltransferase/poly(A) polymerase
VSIQPSRPARSAADVLDRLPEALRSALLPFGGKLALVGGFVRDALLGRDNHDLDLAVDGDAAGVARTLARTLGGAAVPLDRERGTWRVALRAALHGIEGLDLTRLRAPSLEADLRLRDFTINAIAVDLAGGELIDPTGGVADLAGGLLRMAGPTAFADDPLRPLRGARLATQFDLRIDAATLIAARAAAPHLNEAAAERRRDELARIFAFDNAYDGARTLDRMALLSVLLPDLDPGRGCLQPREHYYDVFEHNLHTLQALDALLCTAAPEDPAALALWQPAQAIYTAAPGLRQKLNAPAAEQRPWRVTLKLVGLLHDVSKPETRTVDPDTGKTRFYGHGAAGARRAAALLQGLRFSAREIAYAEKLIADHLRPGMLALPGEQPTRRALYRFARDLGDDLPDLLLQHLADHAAVRGPRLNAEEWQRHIAYFCWLLGILYGEEQVARPARLISGEDVMRELEIPPGPRVGRLLEAVREAQAAGEVSDRSAALALARSLYAAETTAEGGI